MKDIDLCPGGNCPLRMTCERYFWWLQADDDDGCHWEVEPAYEGDKCRLYIQKEYYGG